MQNISEVIAKDHTFNIINILLIDHAYLKECISVLLDESANKKMKIFYARTFLDTLQNHSQAEEKTVYDCLVDMDEFRKLILEGEIEHEMIQHKLKHLVHRVRTLKQLDDVTEVELKVLADFVLAHILEEERDLFPKMQDSLDSGILNEIGFQFMILRKFSSQDLKDHPELQKQIHPSSSWSGNFVSKVNNYISSLLTKEPHALL